MIPDTSRLETLAELRHANRLVRCAKLWSPELTEFQRRVAFDLGELVYVVEQCLIETNRVYPESTLCAAEPTAANGLAERTAAQNANGSTEKSAGT